MIISPSLLSANFAKLGEQLDELAQVSANHLHLDVMDGCFVPNISFGPVLIKSIRRFSNGFFDTHLMITKPHRYFGAFAEAGSNSITFHYEASLNVYKDIEAIKALGVKVGLSIKPDTPVEKIKVYLSELDQVLIMSVMPGFGGQTMMKEVLDKANFIAEHRPNGLQIALDGGVNLSTIALVRKFPIDIAVVGNGLFSAPDLSERFEELAN